MLSPKQGETTAFSSPPAACRAHPEARQQVRSVLVSLRLIVSYSQSEMHFFGHDSHRVERRSSRVHCGLVELTGMLTVPRVGFFL